MDQMWCYLWEEIDDRTECKFGERWVFDGQDPETECRKRIRASLGVRKDKYDEGKIRLVAIWNVSEVAAKVGRLYKQSKMDDYLRSIIGYRKGTTGEVHLLSGDDMRSRVNKLLAKLCQPLPEAALSTPQYVVAEEVIEAIKEGNNIILAELCARFGKTIWSGALAHELNKDLIIVASYVKTVFTSFANDWTSFQQFAGYEHVDCLRADYQDAIDSALKANKPVVAYLSMAESRHRQERIDYLFGWDNSMLIVDEADFGVHTAKQAQPLVDAATDMPVVIMTGTNSDRAATYWKIDRMISVTYPELLIQKRKTQESASVKEGSLQHFKNDPNRDLLVPEFECYQMDLSGPVNKAIESGEVSDDFRELPSWSKFGAAPIKSKGFFTRVLAATFLGQGGHDELNVELQVGEIPKQRVAMMFLSAKKNEALNQAARIAEQTLPGYEVIALNGDATHNNKKINNRYAEPAVKEVVSSGKDVLIISNNMAQRSFSIPEITELYLAYDAGAEGATIQKMSRTLTPDDLNKIGRIFSLSFDPNRDDKFDAMIVATALNYKARSKTKSLREAMQEVRRTIDIFACTEDGRIKIEVDDYLEKALARKGISRVLGKIVDISHLSADDITALANGNGEYFRAAKAEATAKGKTKESTKKGKKGASKQNASQKEIAKARETIVQIVENMDVILISGSSTTIADALEELDNDEDCEWVQAEFGVDLDVIYHLFAAGVIRQDWIELIHEG